MISKIDILFLSFIFAMNKLEFIVLPSKCEIKISLFENLTSDFNNKRKLQAVAKGNHSSPNLCLLLFDGQERSKDQVGQKHQSHSRQTQEAGFKKRYAQILFTVQRCMGPSSLLNFY